MDKSNFAVLRKGTCVYLSSNVSWNAVFCCIFCVPGKLVLFIRICLFFSIVIGFDL